MTCDVIVWQFTERDTRRSLLGCKCRHLMRHVTAIRVKLCPCPYYYQRPVLRPPALSPPPDASAVLHSLRVTTV